MFTVVIKPTHICNLSCSYCFNDDVRNSIMDFRTLSNAIKQAFEYAKVIKFPDVLFIWHGGEPTVAGLDFYYEVVRLQKDLAKEINYSNIIQTNGILINGDWVEFVKESNFQLSISIDGNEVHNDKYRVDVNGKGSFLKIIRAMDLLTANRIQFGGCLTLHKGNISDAKEIYSFLAERKLGFHIVPLMKSGSARERYDEVGLSEDEYADAWIAMYDCWLDAVPTYTYVADFAQRTEAVLRGEPTGCWTSSNCCDTNVSVDPEGKVFSCASVSATAGALYGNVNQDSFETLFASRNALFWRTRQHAEQCTSCKWFHVCHGGCMARSYKFFGDIDVPDYYCNSLFRIYEHIEKRLAEKGIPIPPPSSNHICSQLPSDTRAKLNLSATNLSLSSIPVKVIR